MTKVEFVKTVPGFGAGVVAGIDPELAKKYVADGVAKPAKDEPKAEAEPKPPAAPKAEANPAHPPRQFSPPPAHTYQRPKVPDEKK